MSNIYPLDISALHFYIVRLDLITAGPRYVVLRSTLKSYFTLLFSFMLIYFHFLTQFKILFILFHLFSFYLGFFLDYLATYIRLFLFKMYHFYLCHSISKPRFFCTYFFNIFSRTKRWQRRWFVLYDDGELTYSVDDHPETIPQVGIITILYQHWYTIGIVFITIDQLNNLIGWVRPCKRVSLINSTTE